MLVAEFFYILSLFILLAICELSHNTQRSGPAAVAGQHQRRGGGVGDHGPKQKCTIAQLDRMRFNEDQSVVVVEEKWRWWKKRGGGRIKAVDIYILLKFFPLTRKRNISSGPIF